MASGAWLARWRDREEGRYAFLRWQLEESRRPRAVDLDGAGSSASCYRGLLDPDRIASSAAPTGQSLVCGITIRVNLREVQLNPRRRA